MVVSITLFLGVFFQVVELYMVFIILWLALRLLGWPIRWFVDSISGLHR